MAIVDEPVPAALPLADRVVSDVAREHPSAQEVFDRLGIHTCCGGQVPIRRAAERDGVVLEALLTELRAVPGLGG
jgi:regulator of cell morphogenesis and NO signaling